jgi:tetratricopeptide (TPR) repeat protein
VLLSHAHRKLGELDTARARAVNAVALERNWRSLVTLATVEKARGEDDAAVAAFDAAAEAGPSDTNACTDAAFLLQSRKRYAEASERWKRALARDPELGFAEVNDLVCTFHATGDPEAARKLVEIARGPAKGVEWIAELADDVSPGWREG